MAKIAIFNKNANCRMTTYDKIKKTNDKYIKEMRVDSLVTMRA